MLGHRTGLLRACLALVLAGLLRLPVDPAGAAAPCQPAADAPIVTAAPDDERAAALAQPFGVAAWPVDRVALLQDTQRRVRRELAEIGAPGCYAELLPHIAARVAFLSPFEFAVVGYYEHDWATRDALLQAYRADPRQAVRRFSSAWPSPRAELLVDTAAFFNLDTNQIYVNRGVVTADQATNVLVHEFWHALANVRLEARSGGTVRRTSGFWTQTRAPGSQVWQPIDETIGARVPTYLMNEAVAIEMEVAATGREHPGMRPDLVTGQSTLHQLFDVAGRSRVLRLYLQSRSEELQTIAQSLHPAGD